jgi:protein-disulfide isomerase
MASFRDDPTNLLAFVAVACAVVTTGIIARRELAPKPAPPFAASRRAPVLVDSQRHLARSGHRIGRESARLEIVVFSDMECPACGWFATNAYPQLKQRYGDQIALVYRHFPLAGHRNAYAAAVATECAAAQGRFEAFHDVVYGQQKLLGLKTFSQFASESGVANIPAFEACMKDSSAAAAIEADVRAANAIGATGTPAIVVNGWHFLGGATMDQLDSVTRALTSEKPRH